MDCARITRFRVDWFASIRGMRAALKMPINKNDQNDAEGLAQIVRTGYLPGSMKIKHSPEPIICSSNLQAY
jgi:hypothetical protein